jgi:3'(2'), 5'-bisphosphate nucleotidase
MDYESIVAVMRRLALEAGAAIMEVYARPDFEVRAKDDASPVTEADEAADAIIAGGLAAAFPGIAVVTEEQRASLATATEVLFLGERRVGT